MAISHTVLSESLIMNVPIYWNLLCQTLRKDYVDYLAQCCYLSSLQFDLGSNVRLRVAKDVKCQCSKIEIRRLTIEMASRIVISNHMFMDIVHIN